MFLYKLARFCTIASPDSKMPDDSLGSSSRDRWSDVTSPHLHFPFQSLVYFSCLEATAASSGCALRGSVWKVTLRCRGCTIQSSLCDMKGRNSAVKWSDGVNYEQML